MNELICDAIGARRLLRFIYEGYERVVEPHLYGINVASHEALSAYLVSGWSASSPEPGWRNYLAQQMHDVHVLDAPFAGPRPEYNPDDPAFRQIFCRLESPAPNADALYHRGRERMDAGALDEAAALLRQSVAEEPHFLTLALLGETLARLGRLREAVVPLAASTTLHPQGRAPAQLADVFLRLGRPDEALEMARLALERDPQNELAAAVRDTARDEVRSERGEP